MKPDDLIQGRYRLESPLGKGGMADVWRARDERLERSVAVKFLAPQFHDDPEWLVRFFSEAQSIARISHPNVVSVLDFGEGDGRPYLVMEYASGGSLADYVGDPVMPERAIEVVADAARGAGAAHVAGIVHRDIKPGNILLTDDKHAKLADFGIASADGGERLTATGLAIGSPHYVSPEQASGRTATSRSDVYSLGIVLYELLTGHPPFDANNATGIAIAHVEQQPEPPSTIVSGIPREIDNLVLRCLAKEPAERFEDGFALAAALESPQTVVAVQPGVEEEETGYWVQPPPFWKRTAVGAIGLVLLLVAGAILWASTLAPTPRALSQDVDVHDGTVTPRHKKQPTPTSSAPVSFVETPSPSPSTSPIEEPDDEELDETTVTVVSDDPEHKDPSPEPTSEPTTEPTSQPTPEQTGEAPPP